MSERVCLGFSFRRGDFGVLAILSRRELRRRYVEKQTSILEHGLVCDRVTAIDGFGLVADHRHRGRPRHAGSLQVANRRAAEVVEDATWHATREQLRAVTRSSVARIAACACVDESRFVQADNR
jgi:hypothetical protein